jgi:site-specific recombinase XerD
MGASLHLVDYQGDDERPDLIALHLEACEQRNLRPVYIYNRGNILCAVEAIVGPLADASEQALADWYRDIGRRMQPEARAVQLSHCRMFYRWLVLERFRDDDPTVRLERPRLRRRLPRPIAEKQLHRALEAATPEVRAMLHLAAYAGCRACEIARLHADDVDYNAKTLLIADGKGGRQRVVPLHPELERTLLAAHLPKHGPLFFKGESRGRVTGRRTNEQASPHNVSHRCNQLLCSYGASLHQRRHYFGTEMYRHSQDLRLVQETLGHASPNTTALYTQWDSSKAAGAVNAIGQSPRFTDR